MEPRVHTKKVIDIKARGPQVAGGKKPQVADFFFFFLYTKFFFSLHKINSFFLYTKLILFFSTQN